MKTLFSEYLYDFQGEIIENESASKHSYYGLGGKFKTLLIPQSREDLKKIHLLLKATRVPYSILGLGSNLLVSDSGFDGAVIKTSHINSDIKLIHSQLLFLGASVSVVSLLRKAAIEGWGKLEFLAGIPGSIGGVIAMNGGTFIGDASQFLVEYDLYNLETGIEKKITKNKFEFSYRKNANLQSGDLIVSGVFEIEKKVPKEIKALLDELYKKRKANQPIDKRSCGSVFKNPKKFNLSAWQVIDQLGLRGKGVGGALFSEKHSNFIVHNGQAKSQDVYDLIQLSIKRAKDELGVELEPEVKFLGSF